MTTTLSFSAGRYWKPDRVVEADVPCSIVALEEQPLERLGPVEPQVADVDRRPELRRQLGVEARVARCRTPGLTKLACPSVLLLRKRGNHAAAADEADAGLRETEALAIPEAERPADDVRDCRGWRRTRAPLSSSGSPSPDEQTKLATRAIPVLVERQLHRRELRVDVDRLLAMPLKSSSPNA